MSRVREADCDVIAFSLKQRAVGIGFLEVNFREGNTYSWQHVVVHILDLRSCDTGHLCIALRALSRVGSSHLKLLTRAENHTTIVTIILRLSLYLGH